MAGALPALRPLPPTGAAAPGSVQWSPSAGARRARAVLREEGLRSVAAKVLGETVYRRLDVFERRLGDPTPCPRRGSVGLLAADEVSALRSWAPASDYERRLAAGELCFVARVDSRPASFAWLAVGEPRVEYLACALRLRSDEAYCYDVWTAEGDRGQQLAVACLGAAAEHFRAAGYRRLIATALPENAPGRRSLERAGFRRLGRVGYAGLGRRAYFRRRRRAA